MNDAFLDGYMYKQAIGPGTLRRTGRALKPYAERGGEMIRNWVKDPTGGRAGELATAASRQAERFADRGAQYADDLHRPITQRQKFELGPGLDFNGKLSAFGVREKQRELWKKLTAMSDEARSVARKERLAEAGRPAATATGLVEGGRRGLNSANDAVNTSRTYDHYVDKGLPAPSERQVNDRRKQIRK